MPALPDPWRIAVVPSALPPGDHTLSVTATWNDGDAHTPAPLPFVTEAPDEVTWATVVEPLFHARCAVCHTNGTVTILASQADVEARFDGVLDAVESGRMPLTGPDLTPTEIDLLVRWRDGGFP